MVQGSPRESLRAWLRALPSGVIARYLLDLTEFDGDASDVTPAVELLRGELRLRETVLTIPPDGLAASIENAGENAGVRIERLMDRCRTLQERNAAMLERSGEALMRLQAARRNSAAAASR